MFGLAPLFCISIVFDRNEGNITANLFHFSANRDEGNIAANFFHFSAMYLLCLKKRAILTDSIFKGQKEYFLIF